MKTLTDEIILTGEFVRLRPLRAGDAELTLKWRTSERAALLHPGATTAEQQRAWITSRPSNEKNFMIELIESNEPVGMLSLVEIDFSNHRAESARFLIGEEETVQGLPAAVEAMKLLYAYAFETLNLNRVYGTVVAEYKMLVKWQKYLGMKEEGVFKQHVHLKGEFKDVVCLGLLAHDYKTVALPRMNGLIRLATPKPKAKPGPKKVEC